VTVEEIDHSACYWLVEVLYIHVVDGDGEHAERLQVLNLQREDQDVVKLIFILGSCVQLSDIVFLGIQELYLNVRLETEVAQIKLWRHCCLDVALGMRYCV
jgi:hypothetical protein